MRGQFKRRGSSGGNNNWGNNFNPNAFQSQPQYFAAPSRGFAPAPSNLGGQTRYFTPTHRQPDNVPTRPNQLQSNRRHQMMPQKTMQKTYLCPECNEPYDFYYNNNTYKGKVPLILNCQHTICQECILKKAPIGCILCPVCEKQCEIKKVPDNLLQIAFPPNFYLVGYIMFHQKKAHVNNVENIGLVSEPKKKSGVDEMESSESTEKCCFVSCEKNATMHCPDCNDIYCVDCCQLIHKSAKLLMLHKPTAINVHAFSVALVKCQEHVKMSNEFFCETCEDSACCYCMVEKHQGHDVVYLWKLEPEEMVECENLISDSKTTLKQLLVTQKKVNKLTNYNKVTVERNIHDFFSYCHAILSKSEKNLVDELSTITTENQSLTSITAPLTKSINTLKNILSIDFAGEKKINRKGLLKRLRELKDVPRFLLDDSGKSEPVRFVSQCNAELASVDLQFYIERSEISEYILASEDQLPLNYKPDLSLSTDSDVESIVSSMVSTRKSKKHERRDDKSTKISKHERKSSSGSISNFPKLSSSTRSDIERVTVTHINSMESFYIQYKKMQTKEYQLSKDIEDYIKMDDQRVASPQINELYLARYATKNDLVWCRGNVTEIINGETEPLYEVFFIDYGQTQIVPVNRLKEIPPHLRQPKPFAFECELYNPTNVNWSKTAHISMGKLISGKEVGMWVKQSNDNILVVDLLISASYGSTTSVIELLIHATDNVLAPSDEPSVSTSSGSVTLRPVLRKELSIGGPHPVIHAMSKKFRKNDKENVIIVNAIDPYSVFVHLESFREHFNKMEAAMKKFYKKNVKSVNFVPLEGSFVVVEHKTKISKSKLYRALVKSVDLFLNKVYVLFVDWGMSMTVSIDNVRELDSSFAKICSQVLRVKMADIVPFDRNLSWSPSSAEFLESYKIAQDVLKMVVSADEPDLEVLFFETSGVNLVCINALMVEKNLADPIGTAAQTVLWPNYGLKPETYKHDDGLLATILKKVDDDHHSFSEDQEGPGSAKRQIEVMKVIDPHTIVIKFNEFKEKEIELHKNLQIFYADVAHRKQKDSPWKLNEMCVVLYENQFYRGKIVEKLDSDTYKIYLPDIVQETLAPSEGMYLYDELFSKYRQVAVKCCLANIYPAGDSGKWAKSASESLEQMFEKYHVLYVTKAAEDGPKGHFPVNMWYMKIKPGGALEPDSKIYVSVNEALVKLGFAYNKRKPTKFPIREPKKNVELEVEKTSESDSDFTPVKGSNIPEKEPKSSDKESDTESVTSRASTISRASSNVLTKLLFSPKRRSKAEDDNKESGSELDIAVPEDWNDLIEADMAESETKQQGEEQDGGAEENKKNSPYHTKKVEIGDWQPPFRIEKRDFNAWVTCVETAGYIYLHDENYEDVYRMLEGNLKEYFTDNNPVVKDQMLWRPGQMCTISYNGLWYRGRVLQVINPEKIKVFMIDYGSDHIVSPDSLFREILHPDLPAFATKVRLDQVYPKSGGWFSSDYDTLLKLVPEYCRVVVKGPMEVTVPLVDIYDENGIHLNQKLCDMCPNLVRYALLPENPKQEDQDDVIIEKEEVEDRDDSDEEENEEVTPAKLRLSFYDDFEAESAVQAATLETFKHPSLPADYRTKNVLMSVVNVLDYNKVVLKQNTAESTSEDMYNMVIDIQDGVGDLPHLTTVKPGMPCVARWSQDDVWYRAVVQTYDESTSKAKVLFVDYGNMDRVCLENLKPMKEGWFDVPVECYIAALNVQLVEEEKVDEVLKLLRSFVNYTRIVKVVKEEPLTVDLCDTLGNLCYAQLINDGILTQNL